MGEERKWRTWKKKKKRGNEFFFIFFGFETVDFFFLNAVKIYLRVDNVAKMKRLV